MPAAVGAAGAKAARTASEATGGLATSGAPAGFLTEAVALEDFLAALCEAVDLLELLLTLEDLPVGLDEDLVDVFGEDLLPLVPLPELEGLAVRFVDLADVCASSVAARTEAGSAMQQANVDKSATTRRTGRPFM